MTRQPAESALVDGSAPATQHLPLDRQALHAEAAIRLTAGLVSILAAGWLLAVFRGWLAWTLGIVALTFGATWAVRFARLRRTPLSAEDHFLELSPDGLVVADGKARCVIPWDHVRQISIDQDRLQVCVAREGLPELRIEPQYGGLGTEELAETIYEYSRSATSPGHRTQTAGAACTDAEDD